jgi:glycosyltransferase involved in cell wall biosynthesis
VHARHILLFIEGLSGGGVERIALRLAAGWIAADRRVTILTGDRAGPLAAEIPAGARLVDLGTPHYGALMLATVRAIGRIAPDIVFCPGNYYTAIAAAARLALGRRCPPIIAKISNGFARADFIAPAQAGYRAWLRLHPRFIDRFVALSDGLRDEAIAIAGIAPARIVTIANPAAPPPPLTHGPRAPLILAVGRLVAQKRFERLIEAFAHLPRGLGARLVLLGEGPERARLTAAAVRAGVAGRVHLPGHVADPLPWMARARVVALSSDYEGLPNVLAEALAVGTPVVTTACSAGIADLVHDPRLGSIVPIGDSAAMATALGHWYAATPDRATLRRLAMPATADPARAWLAEMDALAAARGAIAAATAPFPLSSRSAPTG